MVTLTAYKNRLEQAGYIVQTAQDGLEALKQLNRCTPDLILLDLLLPKFTGEDVLKYLNSNPSLGKIPVVVLSTNSILTAANEALVEKADKHFLKHQCTFPDLLKSIEDIFSNLSNPAAANDTPAEPAPARTEVIEEIEHLMEKTPVVCAWTDRIKIGNQWMTLSEFLSKRLHLQITHGVSPEGMQQFFGKKQIQ